MAGFKAGNLIIEGSKAVVIRDPVASSDATMTYDGASVILNKPLEASNLFKEDVNFNYYGPDSAGSNISIAEFPGPPNAEFNILIGKDAGDSIVGGSSNVVIGYEASYSHPTLGIGSSVVIGYQAGYSGKSGILIGYQAGYSASTGSGVYIGYWSGRETTGDGNVFVGNTSGRYNDGKWNVSIGDGSGSGPGPGTSEYDQNVFIGQEIAANITTGSRNLIAGQEAGHNITTGQHNVILGRRCGYNLTTGSANVFIGYKAGYDEIDSSAKLIISNSSTSTPLIEGDFLAQTVHINGTLSADTIVGGGGGTLDHGSLNGLADDDHTQYALTVGSTRTAFEINSPVDGQIVYYDSTSGNFILKFETGIFTEDGNNNIYGGTSAGISITTGTYNFLAGVNAGAATTEADENVLIGRNAGLSITTHEGNVAVGSYALSESQTLDTVAIGYSAARYGDHFSAVAIGKNALQGVSGTSNTVHCVAIGESALRDITTGQFDTGVGDLALNSITSGDSNTAVGGYALRYNEIGDFNTVVGASAGGNTSSSNITDNTFIGYQSGTNLGNSQVGNVAVGSRSLDLLNVGNKNVGIGVDVCDNLNQGNNNVCIGAEIGAVGGSEIYSNNVIIGYQAGYSITASNNTLIGYQAGYSLTTGSDNVFVGYQAGYNIDSTSDLLIIANNASEALIEGDFANRTLHINGTFTSESSNLNTVDTNYTITLDDADTTIVVDSTNNITITVPTDAAASLPDGFTCAILRRNTGEVTVTGDTGVTVGSPDGADTLRVQWSTATLLKIDTNVWALSGDIQ